jgi:hypothetical protein
MLISCQLAENMLTVILRLRQIVLHPTLVPSKYVVSWMDSHKNPEVYVPVTLNDHCLTRLPRCIVCFEGIVEGDRYVNDKCTHFFCSRW